MKKKLLKILITILGILGLSTLVIACYGTPPVSKEDLNNSQKDSTYKTTTTDAVKTDVVKEIGNESSN